MTGVDLQEEDDKFMEYLAQHGWQGDVGEEEVGEESLDEGELEKQQSL